MLLYPLVFSQRLDSRKLLYTLGERNLAPNVRISFDTYFNSFYPQDWVRLTSLNDLGISLVAKGIGKLQVFGLKKNKFGYHKELIVEVEFENQISKEIPNWKDYQLIYPLVEAFSEIQDLNLSYITQDSYPVNKFYLGIVICTYRKEWYVFQILERLARLKFHYLKFQIFVVDNAKTLSLDLEKKFGNLKIIPNSNLGGSGGFTKGMIHCLDSEITHILLMDDDIEIDENVLRRLESFLFLLKDEKICIAGAMLDAQNPNYLYETSASIDFSQLRFHAKNFLTDLSDINNLLKISESEEMEYGAWWFFLFSKKAVEKVGLPFPFFIRGDDVEYSYRLMNHNYYVTRTNGIAIWHEPFDAKLPHWVYYYTWRNLLIISAVYSKGSFFLRYVNLLIYGFYFLSTFQYGILEYILEGVLDFLKGPKYLQNLNPELFHQNLSQRVDLDYEESSLDFYGELSEKRITFFRKFLAFVNLLTLNCFFTKGKFKANFISNTGRLNSNIFLRLAFSLGAKEIEIWIPTRKKMRNFKKNPKRAFKILFSLFKTSFLFLLKSKKIERIWRREFQTLTSLEFWKAYFSVILK